MFLTRETMTRVRLLTAKVNVALVDHPSTASLSLSRTYACTHTQTRSFKYTPFQQTRLAYSAYRYYLLYHIEGPRRREAQLRQCREKRIVGTLRDFVTHKS